MGLQHLSLKTRDLKTTERFYTEVLGLQVAFRHRGMIFLRTPGDEDLLDFCEVRNPFDTRAGGLDHFGIHLTRREFLQAKGRLKTARIKPTGRRGRWAVYVEDPNGYTVEMYAD